MTKTASESKINHDEWKDSFSIRMKRVESLMIIVAIACMTYLSVELFSDSIHGKSASAVTNFDNERINDELSSIYAKISTLNDNMHKIERDIKKSYERDCEKTDQDLIGSIEQFSNLNRSKQEIIPANTIESLRHKNKIQIAEKNGMEDRGLLVSSLFDDRISSCDYAPVLSATNNLNDFGYDEGLDKMINMIQKISSPDSLNNFLTPQYKAACWILFDDEMRISTESNLFIERFVLALLMYTIYHEQGVLITKETCDYDLVECNSDGLIEKIDVGKKRLRSNSFGSIPSEIAHLNALEHIDFSQHGLIGTIPPELGRLKELKVLYLNENSLDGLIPSYLGRLRNLEILRLEKNTLSGSIPSELGQLGSLEVLNLHHNELHDSIPSQIFNCQTLQVLHLYENTLSGTIPTNFDLAHNLSIVNLEKNNLWGSIPSELGMILSLREIWLRFNKLSGEIPSEIRNLQSLELMIFGFNSLSGTLPDFFGDFSNLRVMNVEKNNLTGEIPGSIWNNRVGNAVILEGNNLIGSVPNDTCLSLDFYNYDDSPWFVDQPKVDCACCDFSKCTIWDVSLPKIGGTVRPMCPEKNIMKVDFFEQNWVQDNIANVTFRHLSGKDLAGSTSICLSPSGCYSLYDVSIDSTKKNFKYSLGYSSLSSSLRKQDQCDPVTICGYSFDQNHPKRAGLNHLTQLISIVGPSTKFDTLCWMFTEDDLFEAYSACDGTLLQRYVMALFYFSKSIHLPEISSTHTCTWPGIKCDQSKRFIEHVNFTDFHITGSILTEIGLLARLKTIDLSFNDLTGTIDPSVFDHLPKLEIINVQYNKIKGTIPRELFELPRIKTIQVSHNLFEGTLPTRMKYSTSLEGFFAHSNLIRGSIPYELIECHELKNLDLSRNSLNGQISTTFSNLRKMKVLRLNQNRISGSIPHHLFSCLNLKILALHTNALTGSIPTEVENILNVTKLTLSHNQLKGNVPTELIKLENLQLLHLHNNKLIGTVPRMEKLKNIGGESFISDCGRPSFTLPSQLTCESCTICCNSEGGCQFIEESSFSLEVQATMTIVFVPIAIFFILLFVKKCWPNDLLEKFWYGRDPLKVYNSDSVYSFIFSTSHIAKALFVLISVVQVSFFSLFLHASNIRNTSTDWIFTIRCPGNRSVCEDEKTVGVPGWILFYTVNFLNLGLDFLYSAFQLQRAVQKTDGRLLVSSFCLFALTALALFTSEAYNRALAKNNRDLIVNAVILLFVNDLDEKFFSILQSFAPIWTSERVTEIEASITRRFTDGDLKTDISEFDNNSPQKPQIVLCDDEVYRSHTDISNNEKNSMRTIQVLERYNSGKRMLGIFDDD